MKIPAFHFAIMTLVLSITTAAVGQSHQENELGLLLGSNSVLQSGSSGQGATIDFGHSLTFGLTYAHIWKVSERVTVGIEVPLEAGPSVDVSSTDPSVPQNYAFLFITPGVRVGFRPEGTVRPWLSVGGGYARFDESSTLVSGLPNLSARGTNRGAAQFGAGVDFRTPIKVLFPVGLRLEVRDFYTGQPKLDFAREDGRQHNLIFSGGIILHF
jgi:hypothetical protein